uniref:J domain-containing protein n=1 Tax=Anopheles epiroticus TaxID=199890 RepID=A0A182P8E1_9DIPT
MSSQAVGTRQQNASYYDVLQVSRTATTEEIRRSYQTLALQYHPDKRKVTERESTTADGGKSADHLFICIDEAWKTLRDDRLRRIYDAELMQRSGEYFVNEVLTRADFEWDAEGSCFMHTCRCGGYYILPEEEPTAEQMYVSCDECSLVVQVNAGQ